MGFSRLLTIWNCKDLVDLVSLVCSPLTLKTGLAEILSGCLSVLSAAHGDWDLKKKLGWVSLGWSRWRVQEDLEFWLFLSIVKGQE